MWDISEYLPFEAFIVICVFILGYIACQDEIKDIRKNK